MVAYRNCSFNDLVNDAKSNGRTEELKNYGLSTVSAKRVDKETGNKVSYKRQRTFLEIKKWYYSMYYPEMLPKAKPKPATIYDQLAEL